MWQSGEVPVIIVVIYTLATVVTADDAHIALKEDGIHQPSYNLIRKYPVTE